MKNLLIIFLIMMTAACSADDANPKPVVNIDPDLQAYVDLFLLQAQSYGYDVAIADKGSITVKKLPDNSVQSKSSKVDGIWMIEIAYNLGGQEGEYPCVLISVYRELSRVLLDKDYSCEPPAAGLDNIMCGDYPYICKSNHAGALFNDWKKEVKFLFTGSV